MNREEIKAKVFEIVALKSEHSVSEISEETSFRNDLSLDSMTLVDSIVEVEEYFDVEIPDNRLFNINSVGDLIDFLEEEVE